MTDADLAKLRWRCRRGTRELDGLMLGWLDTYYPNASASDRVAFSSLLDLQDPDLMALIVAHDQQGSENSANSTQAAVLRQIRKIKKN